MANHVTAEQIRYELDQTTKTLPIYEQMPSLFTNRKMFDSYRRFEDEGFRLALHAEHKMMAGSHKSARGYLFKKYNNDKDGAEQIRNYMRRIEGARLLRRFIDDRGFTRVTVPGKWLYELPSDFPERYLLVVEKLDLLEIAATARAYHRIGKDQTRELATVLYYFRGLNSTAENLPYTEDGKIAFVDTERWSNNKDYLRRVGERMPIDRRDLAQDVYDQLRRAKERPFSSQFK
ncbi:MAG TPA: hypothetical protein VLE97_05885 [Gaiellaceae bacterium]|nr:hypothetical protein [Gaiellaceae bacterium]